MNLISTICFTWFMIVFCISGLFINFLQLLVLPLYWIKRDWYNIIIPGFAYGIFSQFTWMAEWWGEMDFKLYVDDINELNYIGKESSIVISNHYSDIDWLAGWVFAERVGVIGRTKVISKSEVKYTPIVGWCWWFAEFGFLKRNWQEDKKNFCNLVNSMKRNNNNFMMMLMCEGTRRTQEKLLASQEYAQKNNFAPLKHHLFPRTKGFSLMVEALHNKVPAIYDLEFGFPNIESTNVQNIINRGKIEVLMHFRRIPMSELPKSFDELSNYVVEHYRAKDKLYEHFIKTKEFPGILVPLPRRYFNLILFSVWNVLVFTSTVLWFNYCVDLYGGNLVMAISSLFLIGVYSMFKFLQNYTQTKKGSTFGLKDK